MGRPPTSCDECHRQRLGCNAILQQGRPCFNCDRKGIVCSMRSKGERIRGRTRDRVSRAARGSGGECQTAISDAATTLGNIHTGTDEIVSGPLSTLMSPAPSYFSPASLSRNSDDMARCQQAGRLHSLLWNVFTAVLEPRIGLWIGGGCPFKTINPVSLGTVPFSYSA